LTRFSADNNYRRTTVPPKENQAPLPRDPTGPGAARLWLLRALTVMVIPALLLLALEGALRLANYGRPAGFLIPDEKTGWFRTNPDFAGFFLPRNFDLRPLNFRIAAQKAPNALRVVVLGESAAQGVPAPAFGFAPQLGGAFRAREPGRGF
jgi:hypothetical protein